MNKVLNLIRIFLLIVLCFLNVYCIFIKHTNLVSWSNLLYLVLFLVIIFLTIKDFIKSSSINENNTYLIISIISFLIMNFILFRAAFDTNLFFNKFSLDNFGSTFFEYRMLYLRQNIIYFIVMLVLVLFYRGINLKVKSK